jgi:MoxR-like ATPase
MYSDDGNGRKGARRHQPRPAVRRSVRRPVVHSDGLRITAAMTGHHVMPETSLPETSLPETSRSDMTDSVASSRAFVHASPKRAHHADASDDPHCSNLGAVTAALSSPTFSRVVDAIVGNVSKVIVGKDDAVLLAIVCMLSDGHLLIEDVPGVGKTSLAKALARSVDCSWSRIQFTPDLLPSDLIGVSVWRRQSEEFRFEPGPVFANVVLADEINRASPKTQSALLEAMEERQVTADGITRALPRPFLVIATQNPIEHEGTYRLPESQLDRFHMRLSLGYPDRAAELAILDAGAGTPAINDLQTVVSAEEILEMTAAAQRVHMASALRGYIVDIAEASRRHPGITLGLSPRATVQLARTVRVLAAACGRDFATPDDVKTLAVPVLAHRLSLRHEAMARGLTDETAIAETLAAVPVPTRR